MVRSMLREVRQAMICSPNGAWLRKLWDTSTKSSREHARAIGRNGAGRNADAAASAARLSCQCLRALYHSLSSHRRRRTPSATPFSCSCSATSNVRTEQEPHAMPTAPTLKSKIGFLCRVNVSSERRQKTAAYVACEANCRLRKADHVWRLHRRLEAVPLK